MRHWITTLIFLGLTLSVSATSSTISYQGQLEDAAGPVTDTHEMAFRLFDSETGGGQIGSTVSFATVSVIAGLFQVELDFGSEAFSQGPRYLEVEVAGSVLEPRQPVSPAPMALNVLNLPDIEDTLSELSCLTGEIPKWDGSAWVCAEDEDTQFSAGEGLQLSGTSFALDTEFTDARYWRLGGNSEMDSTNNVLGTTDFLALDIQVDGRRAFRFQPSSTSDQEPNLIGGHESNAVLGGSTRGATIAGGGQLADDNANVISASWGFIGGGLDNLVQGFHGVVSGGASNQALGLGSTIGGGTSNQASGLRSVVSGGFGNHALSLSATVPGGSFNRAEGEYSFAAGLRARALHDRSFVWSGRDSTDSFSSTGTHQFLIAADGGVGINTNSPLATLDVEGDTRLGGAVAIDFSDENDMPPEDGFDLPTLFTRGTGDVESLYFGTSNSAEPVFRSSSVRTLGISRNYFTLARPLEGSTTGQAAELIVEGFATIENSLSVDQNAQVDGALLAGGPVGINTTSPQHALDVDGTIGGTRVEVDEDLAFFDGTPQRTAGPIAKAYINSDGSIANSVNIEAVEWDAGLGGYRVTVTGENYWFNRYVATITQSGTTPTAVSTSSQGGNLLVFFDGGAQRNFQLVVHDLPNGTLTQEALADSSALEVTAPRGQGTDLDDDATAASQAVTASGTLAAVRTENQALRKEVADLEARLEALEQLLIGSE